MAQSVSGSSGIGGVKLTAFLLSIVLVIPSIACEYVRLPQELDFVNPNRFMLVVAAYAILMVGMLLPGG